MDPRVRCLNDSPERRGARYVLYWAQMNRRADSNHSLEFAVSHANRLKLPVLVYEAVTCTYPFASDRFHTFLLAGVPETARRLRERGIGYVFYLRKRRSDANDIPYRLAAESALVVTDDYPVFIPAAHNASVPAKIGVPYFAVDSSCIVPMRSFEKKEYAAYTIRPKIHRVLGEFLRPVEQVVAKHAWNGPPPGIHLEVTKEAIPDLVASCEIDHSVRPSMAFTGGRLAAEARLRAFLGRDLARYGADKNDPGAHATSNLSPWLHFGHISPLEVALAAKARGPAPEFLEELIVRRELAFNHALWAPRADELSAIPGWALDTLYKHAGDRREHVYSLEQFEAAQTHDPLWNACQHELLMTGKIHGYYRMYWGKKIIEWSSDPESALAVMIHLNDKYALDGRDPNTYTNILWCFGLHDRPWGEREVFGMVRFMSFDGMKRKTSVDSYLREISFMRMTGTLPPGVEKH